MSDPTNRRAHDIVMGTSAREPKRIYRRDRVTLWNISVVNMGVNSHQPVYVELIIRNTYPDDNALEAFQRGEELKKLDTPVFFAHKNPMKTTVTHLSNPLLELTCDNIIERAMSFPTSFLRNDRDNPFGVDIDEQVKVIERYWTSGLYPGHCEHIFPVIGYVNRQAENAAVPRLMFKSAMVRKLESILMKGLDFKEGHSHCAFTIQFRRYNLNL